MSVTNPLYITTDLEPYTRKDASMLDQYFRYITERQAIWHRRFVQKVEPPWTNDPVLQKFSFTNVYRELDRGTLFYKEQILQKFSAYPSDLLAATILFRRFGRNETWSECFAPNIVPGGDWDWPQMYVDLLEAAKRFPVFTASYLVSGCRVQPGMTKIQNQWEDAYRDFLDSKELWEELTSCATPASAHKALMKRDGLGPFMAYEVYSDLMYSGLLSFMEDDWANAGPGAKRGLKLIFPQRSDYLQEMYDLRNLQFDKFSELELPFYKYAVTNADGYPRPLTMRNIEHNCCEFLKYDRGFCRFQFKNNGDASYVKLMEATR